jgi:hypothetical protein
MLALALQIITPFNVYFNSHLIFKKGEIWRLLTNFFFFGNLGTPLLLWLLVVATCDMLDCVHCCCNKCQASQQRNHQLWQSARSAAGC